MDSIIEENLKEIKNRIARAAGISGQREEDIELVAITKNVDIDLIKTAIRAGITNFGENKAQEISRKYEQLRNETNISWHFVGHLQRNKVKLIIDFVDLIQSVDSLKLVEEIDRRAREKGKTQNILVQVNTAKEEAKYGLGKEEVEGFLRRATAFSNVKVNGLMNIAPFVADSREARPVFNEMKMLFEELKETNIPGIELEYLSMGMTNDFEVAIESGANMIRIGTGIFSTMS